MKSNKHTHSPIVFWYNLLKITILSNWEVFLFLSFADLKVQISYSKTVSDATCSKLICCRKWKNVHVLVYWLLLKSNMRMFSNRFWCKMLRICCRIWKKDHVLVYRLLLKSNTPMFSNRFWCNVVLFYWQIGKCFVHVLVHRLFWQIWKYKMIQNR